MLVLDINTKDFLMCFYSFFFLSSTACRKCRGGARRGDEKGRLSRLSLRLAGAGNSGAVREVLVEREEDRRMERSLPEWKDGKTVTQTRPRRSNVTVAYDEVRKCQLICLIIV